MSPKTAGVKKRLLCSALVVLAGAGLGRAQPLPDRMEFQGQVVDSNGKAIGGAAVTLRRQNEPGALSFWGDVTYTDARGKFSFPDAEEGTYSLSVESGSFSPVQGRSQVLTAGMAPLQIALGQVATLPIRFTAPDGTPVKDQFIAIGFSNGTTFSPTQRLRTDANGTATLSNLPPGSFRLEAIVPDKGYADIAGIQVKSGTNAELVVLLKAGATLRITAREAGENGRALGGVRFPFTRKNDPDTPASKFGEWMYISTSADRTNKISRDGDGTIEFANLPPGKYDVTATEEVPGWQPAQGKFEIKDAPTVEVSMLLQQPTAKPAQFAVTLKNADGTPAKDSDFLVTASLMGTQAEKPPIAVDGAAVLPAKERVVSISSRRVRTDGEGKFVLYPLSVGKWKLVVRQAVEAKVETVNGVTTDALDVTAAGATLEATLAPTKNVSTINFDRRGDIGF